MKHNFPFLIKIICCLSVISLISLGGFIYLLLNSHENIIENSPQKNQTNFISMLVEQADGTYIETKDTNWPEEGYLLDQAKSGCENGGKISYTNKEIKVEATSSDRCYVYFSRDTMKNKCDLGYAPLDSAVCTILKTYGIDKNLYYHDGHQDNVEMPNSNLEAGDFSYRYSGASNEVNNYVCLDDSSGENKCNTDANLYRIIGLFPNEIGTYELKLIKYDYATTTELGDAKTAVGGTYIGNYNLGNTYYKGNNYNNIAGYYWSNNYNNIDQDNNMWQYSNFNKINLNSYYLNTYLATISGLNSHIAPHKWITGGFVTDGNAQIIYNNELGANKLTINDSNCYASKNSTTPQKCQKEDLEYTAKIGLMYVSDYGYAASPSFWNKGVASNGGYASSEVIAQNWMHMGITEWTITRVSSLGVNPWHIVDYGRAGNYTLYNNRGARPAFYLTDDTKIQSGYGSYDKPYRLLLN